MSLRIGLIWQLTDVLPALLKLPQIVGGPIQFLQQFTIGLVAGLLQIVEDHVGGLAGVGLVRGCGRHVRVAAKAFSRPPATRLGFAGFARLPRRLLGPARWRRIVLRRAGRRPVGGRRTFLIPWLRLSRLIAGAGLVRPLWFLTLLFDVPPNALKGIAVVLGRPAVARIARIA